METMPGRGLRVSARFASTALRPSSAPSSPAGSRTSASAMARVPPIHHESERSLTAALLIVEFDSCLRMNSSSGARCSRRLLLFPTALTKRYLTLELMSFNPLRLSSWILASSQRSGRSRRCSPSAMPAPARSPWRTEPENVITESIERAPARALTSSAAIFRSFRPLEPRVSANSLN